MRGRRRTLLPNRRCDRDRPRSRSPTVGEPSAQLLPKWACQRERTDLTTNALQQTLTWTDPDSGLQVRCVGIEYRDFPGGRVDAVLPQHRDGRHADPGEHPGAGRGLAARGRAEFLLHHAVGSPANGSDYGPLRNAAGARRRQACRRRRRAADQHRLVATSTCSGARRA